jgi:hypothetical protein
MWVKPGNHTTGPAFIYVTPFWPEGLLINEEYIAKAAYCREMAETALGDEMRARWLELATHWLGMVREHAPSEGNVVQGDFEPKTMGDRLKG